MANTTHHVKSDLKHRKNQPEPKTRPTEQQTQTERAKQPLKPPTARPQSVETEDTFDAPGSQRPPADS